MSDLKDRLKHAAFVSALTAPTSRGLNEVVEIYPLDQLHTVRVFGESDCRTDRVLRTEMVYPKGRIHVHRNVGRAPGIYANTPRWTELNIISTRLMGVPTLSIRADENTSPTNPLYRFWQDRVEIGTGSGSRLDLDIARQLFNARIENSDDGRVSPDIIDWINGHLR